MSGGQELCGIGLSFKSAGGVQVVYGIKDVRVRAGICVLVYACVCVREREHVCVCVSL